MHAWDVCVCVCVHACVCACARTCMHGNGKKNKCRLKHKVKDIDFTGRGGEKREKILRLINEGKGKENRMDLSNLHSNFPISLFILGPLIEF